MPYYSPSVEDWQDETQPDESELAYTLFLLGDSRYAYTDEAFLSMIESSILEAGDQSAVIFLGDNVYRNGLPDSTSRSWPVAQESLMAQLKILEKYEGEVIFIPGLHDWAGGHKEGLEYVKNQRKYIEGTLDQSKVFLPKKGQPGPVEVHLTNDIVVIVIDSYWWFHEYEKSYEGIVDEADFFVQIEDAISRNRDKKIVFAAHNPLYSVGNHGGHFAAIDNLFPLLLLNKALYIPLPGFLYTGFRKFLGMKEDLAHPQYKLMIEALLETFEGQENIIYAAGHEDNLQYVKKDSIHHIVSGAAGITSYVAQSKKTDFAQMQKGFAKLEFYHNGDVWLDFLTFPDEVPFRKRLFNKPVYDSNRIEQYLSNIDYSDSTVTTYPNGEKYQAGKFKRAFFGNNYREEWVIPVEVPVFDFSNETGELEIVKKGGGGQTKSLRLENEKGQQWVLRSLEKDPSKVIPEVVKMQLAVDMAQDQMSAYLPWASLSVPRMADAAEIYHANPQIVYLTKDPRLGPYKDDVWEGLYLFEERPEGNRKDVESFGKSKDIIGTPDMFDEITDDHDNRVDQEHFLKCRLFDVFIGDWDRHEDQWRWAGFEDDNRKLYRAIPRDRDQTFFLNEGFFPWISSRKFALRINQGFDYEIKDLEGLISQGKWLDRRFLNELTKKDWIKAAEKMQAGLTDEILTQAVYDMPEQITEVKGATTIAKLKSRRDQLPLIAEEYYSFISKKVDVIGSDKSEKFQVERLNDNETEVKVWSLNSDGEKKDKIYDRVFLHNETKEIRLYGLNGKDEFDVDGKVNSGMKVRIIGGPGKDDIKDKSKVQGPIKKTIIYDTKKKNDIEFGSEARNRTTNRPEMNGYRYNAFNYTKTIPLAFVGFNADDGAILGGGFIMTTYGFQKDPYATHHTAGARYATSSNSFEFVYDGFYRSVLMGLDLSLQAGFRGPRYSQNFFGWGNETEKVSDDKDYHRVRIGQISVHPELSKTIGKSTIFAGLFYDKYSVEETDGRYISDLPANGLDQEIFETQDYSGINAGYQFDSRDSKTLPTRGLYWNSEASFHFDLDHAEKTYNRIGSDLSLFLSFRKPNRTVLAFRIGGMVNFGDYEFFQACALGGNSNLRGYRATRYSGDACLYQNSEIRFRLFNFSNYISKGEFGILAFNDVGRVWFEGEESNRWHHGYGGGIWVSPFSVAVLSASYERSKDELGGLFSLRFKYLF
jgi:hypothetical protein